MNIISKTKRVLRGDVDAGTVAREAVRRFRVAGNRRREKSRLTQLNEPVRLLPAFSRMSASDLLAHFRNRVQPKFFPGFESEAYTVEMQQRLFPDQTQQLIDTARRISHDHCWTLLGFEEKCFGTEIDWHRDPLSGADWPLVYHADINLMRNDGSDARVVWELNRMAHLITLGRAYRVTIDERLSQEFFQQLSSWAAQNPVGRGVNWNCAMEVALRAMNLLASLVLFLRAPQLDEVTLKEILTLYDQHGAHISRNLEFSHIANSNHYLADVTGLLWLGLMLPELRAADEWREFGLRELLTEMEKQILPDGADYEASTGYHRLKVELFLYSFALCQLNEIAIEEKYWSKLRAMIEYLRAYLRPDGRAPLIGDSDSGQALPLVKRRGDDHSYLLAVAAAAFHEPRFKLPHATMPEELLWLFGERGLSDYHALPERQSQLFPDAGVCILRREDLYLHLNAGGIGVNGRGSHGHNDALSIEVSACGTAFIVDPGSYLYTADLRERHLFRSTAYHSTVQIDGVEQNSTEETQPFVIGNEARPRVLTWESTRDADLAVAEHYGYRRLPQPITHRRTIRFDKRNRFWLVQDELAGEGNHTFDFRFHFAPNLQTGIGDDAVVEVCDKMNGARLLILRRKVERQSPRVAPPEGKPELESRFSSHDYGAKEASVSACWSVKTSAPVVAQFLLVPVRADEDRAERLKAVDVCIS